MLGPGRGRILTQPFIEMPMFAVGTTDEYLIAPLSFDLPEALCPY